MGGRTASGGAAAAPTRTAATASSRSSRAAPGAAHIAVLVFARGLLKPLLTRIYFPGEPANAADPLLAALTDEERAGLMGTAAGEGAIRFDIHLQGDRQTTFLAL